MNIRTAIIIPTYNHGTRIAEVIDRARPLGLPIIVVNDGSTDDTAQILARNSDLTILFHSENRGKGAALLTGFSAALDMGCNQVVTLDADGQHRPEEAKLLIQAAKNRFPCLVLGLRQQMSGKHHVPWTSRSGRWFSNFWVRAAGGPRVGDSQSGFRLYPLPQVLELGVRARRYQFEVEVLVLARRMGLEIVEVPISVVYQPGEERISHFQPWPDFKRNSATFSRLFFERILRTFRQ